ncbi:unnamed protein product [Pieris brassicae]|uniref:Tc1-like transposase DDE domain-containing protein n=1 Tax=Pieris brassicae TaxID=7116 RepID=A0A9P0X4L6_PIEBR|nr:unnamed protein product [Pieris brassicae]
MNTNTFEKWFQESLPKLEPNSIVVMDNASYHSRRQEKTPVTSWKNMTFNSGYFQRTFLLRTMTQKIKNVKTQYQSYVIDEMAKAAGVEVLKLPPYHCELNPIELVWADVKGYVARNNTTFYMVDVKKLLQEGLNSITIEKLQNCISHVIKEELKFGGLDSQIHKTLTKIKCLFLRVFLFFFTKS